MPLRLEFGATFKDDSVGWMEYMLENGFTARLRLGERCVLVMEYIEGNPPTLLFEQDCPKKDDLPVPITENTK